MSRKRPSGPNEGDLGSAIFRSLPAGGRRIDAVAAKEGWWRQPIPKRLLSKAAPAANRLLPPVST
jgi:hypothetical protein